MSTPAFSPPAPGAAHAAATPVAGFATQSPAPVILRAASSAAATPPVPVAQLQQQQQQLPPADPHGGFQRGASVAGSVMSQSQVHSHSHSHTLADAPNEARRLIQALCTTDEAGLGRLSLVRISRELQGIVDAINGAFDVPPAPPVDTVTRIQDLLASLDELLLALGRSGLGALPLPLAAADGSSAASGGALIDVAGLSSLLSRQVQASFKARQRTKDGAGVARSVLK